MPPQTTQNLALPISPPTPAICADSAPTTQDPGPRTSSSPATSGTSGGGKSVYLETFGCQMNVLDTQLVRGQLLALGYRFTDDCETADVVLYNTCSVREHAEQKVHSRIGMMGVRKRQQPDRHLIVGVLGCMAEREGADLVRKHPQIDLLCGPGELDKVPMLIDNAIKTKTSGDAHSRTGGPSGGGLKDAHMALQGNTHRRSSTLAAAADELEMLDLSRSFSPDEHTGSAYVRITRGCNKFCTYCVVPQTRGAEVHRPPEHILDECRKLVDAGVLEITLLGQTVNHYHFDNSAAVTINGLVQPQIGSVIGPNRGTGGPSPVFGPSVTSFAHLLRRIHDEIPALQRLRFVTNFPRDFGDDILQTMRDCPRICRYLHLPVQSGSNRLLKLMNRGYTIEEYRDLLARIAHFLPGVPGCTLATDIICGFPSETEEDHQTTMRLLEESNFKNSFIFKYSPRPGTAAHDRLPDDVPEEVKKRRNNELLAVQSKASERVHASYQNKTVRVFVESISARTEKSRNTADNRVTLAWEKPDPAVQLTGRTDGDLIVVFDGDESLVGQLVDVQIDRTAPLALFGKVSTAPCPS